MIIPWEAQYFKTIKYGQSGQCDILRRIILSGPTSAAQCLTLSVVLAETQRGGVGGLSYKREYDALTCTDRLRCLLSVYTRAFSRNYPHPACSILPD